MVLPSRLQLKLKRRVAKKMVQAAYPSSHYQKALYFKQNGDKSSALVEFLKATQQNPRLVKAFYEQALIFRERGYLKLAQSSLEQALAAKPNYQEGRMLLATLQIQQGNIGAAMQQLGQSLGISLGTTAGEKQEQEQLPLPTVLQSLHSLLPESITKEIGKIAARKSTSSSKQPFKSATKPEQKLTAANLKVKGKADSNNLPQLDAKKTDAVRIAEPEANKEIADSSFGLHIPNPLHLFWPSTKAVEEKVENNTNTEVSQLPKSPPAEATQEQTSDPKVSAKKRQKRSKKPWLSRWLTVLDDQPAVQTVPPAVESATANGAAALKVEQASEIPAQVETFQKPDEPKAMIEKVAALATAVISSAGKTAFQIPNLPMASSSLFNTLGASTTSVTNDSHTNLSLEEPKDNKPQIAPNSDDPWSVRLRYLADHGTGTLKEGEAFMFSEESGEATLFLSDGQTVRRTIYLPRDAQEVVKQRRPDILTPDDLLYNLSLLAKLMPKQNEQGQSAVTAKPEQQQQSAPNFQVNDLMGKSQSFWGWLKGALKI
jgi:tetratricopeptide (TPR) repeat protein